MLSRSVILTAVAVAAFFAASQRARAAESAFTKDIRPLLETYCFGCHDSDKPKAEVNLEQFTEEAAIWTNPKLWERVLVQLRDKVMPPPKKKQPAPEERAQLADWVHARLEHPDLSQIPRDPGPLVIHRLSRLEYNFTIRDLLGVDTHPTDQFPPDGGGGGGFDNNAATLFIPPILFERYFATAGEVLAAAQPERVFSSRPGQSRDETTAARESLATFASRAFRRPADEAEVARLLALYEASRTRGESWDEAVKLSCRAVLISPNFLFRIETAQPDQNAPYRISSYELASRLSYFLWSSMPDAELLARAAAGNLHEPEMLAAEIRRMLADPKASGFAESFTSQWLRSKDLLTTVNPAPDKFPQFTPELRDAMIAEPVAFMDALVRENRSLIECLDADYTFANEKLAAFYGLSGVTGPAMQRVSLTDRNRGGVLGMSAVLAVTSYPRRTSPVLRGKWVMEEILGTSPAPPPPLVDTQKIRSDKVQDGLTFRQRLEQHRQDPNCAGCHARMDPLGFGLENFDLLGAWRTEVGGAPVDASGVMVTGEKFTGPAELKQLLLARKDEFLRNLTEKMLAYALGRGLEPCDWISVRQIASAVASDEYRAQRLVMEIVQSFPFQYRRPNPAKTVAQTPP